MDRNISQQEQNKGKIGQYRNVVLILGVLVLGYFGLRSLLMKSGKASDFHISAVETGLIKQTLSADGIIVPASERVINAPVATEIEAVLMTAGTEVEKNDLILKLDQELTALEYEKLRDELSLRKNNIEKLNLQYDKDLKDSDYTHQIKALQLSELEAQLGDARRLLSIGGATEEEVESADLQVKIARLEQKMLQNDLTFKRTVNSTDKRTLQLEYDIQAKRLRELSKKLKETEVRAPNSGVITWVNEDLGRTVNQGEPLVRIANLDRYRVEGRTSDRNSKDLQVGLQVEVRIGQKKLKGSISRILPEVANNTIQFDVQLDEDNHELLRPNLRTEINIIIRQKENVVRAKRGKALKGTTSQFFFKVNEGQAQKVRVKKGLVSSDYFEVLEGLEIGDKIIISDTEDYDHLDQFTINEQ